MFNGKSTLLPPSIYIDKPVQKTTRNKYIMIYIWDADNGNDLRDIGHVSDLIE